LCNCVISLYPLNGTVIICGDFNFQSIDWSADSSLLTSSVTCTGIFLEFYYTHGLRQLVCKLTRGERILDLVLSNDIHSVLNYRILEPFSTSDHSQVSFDLPHKVSTYDYTFNTRDFQSADWSSVRSYLDNIDFYETYFKVIFPHRYLLKSFTKSFMHVLNCTFLASVRSFLIGHA
jgi:hypothetical protein